MNTQTLKNKTTSIGYYKKPKTEVFYPAEIAEKQVYRSQIEEDMGQTAIHFEQIQLLFSLLKIFFASRKDVLVAADLVVYYEENNPKKWIAPDVFVCFGVEKLPLRRTFKTWEEKVFPQVVFEIASEATWKNDVADKLELYRKFGVEEYYLLDPERDYLPQPLMAFHKINEKLQLVNIENKQVMSPLLGLAITDTGKFFRLFDNNKNRLLRTLEEIAELTGEF